MSRFDGRRKGWRREEEFKTNEATYRPRTLGLTLNLLFWFFQIIYMRNNK